MTMSPSSSSPANCSTVCPVSPAGIITQATRGLVSFPTNSSSVGAPTAPSASSFLIESGNTSYTTQSWPSRIRRRTMLAPIRPSPIIPSCIVRLSRCRPRLAAVVIPATVRTLVLSLLDGLLARLGGLLTLA